MISATACVALYNQAPLGERLPREGFEDFPAPRCKYCCCSIRFGGETNIMCFATARNHDTFKPILRAGNSLCLSRTLTPTDTVSP